MSESQTVPPPVPDASVPAGSLIAHATGVLIEPRTAYASILRTPGRWWVAVLGCVLLNIVFTGIWTSKVDAHQFIRNQIEQSGKADKIPADRMETVVDQQARFMKPFSWVASTVFPFLGVAVLGAILMFIYRFFYSGEVSFSQSLSVVSWQALALALVSVPLILIVMAAKGDWNLDPSTALGANLTLFLDKGHVSKALYALAGSLDLFTFWSLFLLATGYSVLVRKPTASTIWGVAIPWAVFVAGRVALTALMG